MSHRQYNQKASSIPKVELIPELAEKFELMVRTCEFFFKEKLKIENPPFRGFILEGPPGTGKTELVRQVARKLDERMPNVGYTMLDGASVAAPKWGEAEKNLREAFHSVQLLKEKTRESNPKLILLFDDIESLMIARGATLAKEWHYAINSILFHELDALKPSDTIVCATTNRPDLVDRAIRTRLYPISIPPVPIESLERVITEILEISGVDGEKRRTTVSEVLSRLSKMENPTIREARFLTVMVCIENKIWNP